MSSSMGEIVSEVTNPVCEESINDDCSSTMNSGQRSLIYPGQD
jgi:hypothetical protein